MIYAERYHDFSAGHRVVGHENKCRHLHGHNYRVHFKCSALQLDNLGRVIDFGIIKDTLCAWVEQWWDHKTILWDQDPIAGVIDKLAAEAINKAALTTHPDKATEAAGNAACELGDSIVLVPFNPTAENMGLFLLNTVAPVMLANTGVTLVAVCIEETRKCSALVTLTSSVKEA